MAPKKEKQNFKKSAVNWNEKKGTKRKNQSQETEDKDCKNEVKIDGKNQAAKHTSVKNNEKTKRNEVLLTNNSAELNIPRSQPQNSVININNVAYGRINISNYTKFKKIIIKKHLSQFRVQEVLCPFERRVTSIAWHPVYPQIFVSGSKGGELNLHRIGETEDFFRPGIGAGGSIVGLKFCLDDPCSVYTASVSGLLRKEDFHGIHSKNLMSTLTWQYWFSSLDICYKRKILLVGDSTGHSYLLETSGKQIWKNKKKLHKMKITHCEFNHHNENIFVTASVDRTMKLWDIRMLQENSKEAQPLGEFHHDAGINAAVFSPSNGLNILTTDQQSQLRVYSGPGWTESLVINHPHRQFQHMTPIKATWHPMEDIIIVGRYPDDKFLPSDGRTIDFIDASSGEQMLKINSPSGNIVTLCAMNISGDALACSAGFNVTFLRNGNILDEVSSKSNDFDEPPIQPPKHNRRQPAQKDKNSKTVASKKITKKITEM